MKSDASRTIDLFTGKTAQEQADEAERIRTGSDLSDTEKSRETIEEASQRWREAAFIGQEWTSQHFGKPDHEGREYRVSIRAGWVYLEQTDNTGMGAYHYGGLMLPESALPKLATVIVEAARAYKKMEKP